MRNHARLVFAISVVATIALYTIPQARPIAYPLILLSTLAHELGHGLTALALGGDFQKLQMWADGSGVAHWGGNGGRLQGALVSAGGLVGPAIASAICLLLAAKPRGARACLAALAVAMIVVAVIFIPFTNPFGLAFVGGVGLLALAVAIRAPVGAAQGVLVFAAVQLALAVFSRADYLFTPVARTSAGDMPSDVAQIADALFLPYWFWGGVCALVSVAALVGGMTGFLRATKSSS